MTAETPDAALGKPIALGRTAEVYAWKEGQILKLYYEWTQMEWVEREADVSRVIYASGYPIPAVGEIIQVNGRNGLVFERVDGVSLLERINSRVWELQQIARLLAELHTEMHSLKNLEIPSLRQRLVAKISALTQLPDGQKQRVLDVLYRLPDGDSLCHGDFHLDNVLMTNRGPVVIDWMDATRGNPIADMARTSLLNTIGVPPEGLSSINIRLLQVIRGYFQRAYQSRYFRLSHASYQEVNAWRPVIAAARLLEGIPGEQDRLVKMVDAGLSFL